MKDMNVAKLTSQDLPLFNGIVSDLFPGVETPTIDYGKVTRCKILNPTFPFFFVITYHLQVTKIVDKNSFSIITQLRTAIEKDVKEAGLKPHPSTILKVIQLYETKNSRCVACSVLTTVITT